MYKQDATSAMMAKTAWERIKGRKPIMPLVPFGETVMFKLPKVPNMAGDFRDRHEQGIWLGYTLRSGEYLIGCATGVYTVSSVNRRAEDQRWSSELLKKIVGTSKGPVPGSGSHRMVAYAKKRGQGHHPEPVFA